MTSSSIMFCFVTYWHSRPHQDTRQPEKEDVTKRVIHDSFWWFYWMIIGNFGDCHEPQYQGTRRRQQSCRWDTWGSSSRGLLARCTTTIATLLCINVSFMISIIFLYHYYYSIILRLCIIIADMKFVQNFTPPDFQAKNFTPPISPNFNSFSKKKHKK